MTHEQHTVTADCGVVLTLQVEVRQVSDLWVARAVWYDDVYGWCSAWGRSVASSDEAVTRCLTTARGLFLHAQVEAP